MKFPFQAYIFMFIFFKDFNTLNPDFGPVVIFLVCSFHCGHRTYSKCDGLMNADQSGKVWIRVPDSDPVIQQLFMRQNMKFRRVPDRYEMQVRIYMLDP
jgi:hypothetical protein